MSTTAIGASFTYVPPRQIDASQPGRSKEAQSTDASSSSGQGAVGSPPTQPENGYAAISQAITSGSAVPSATLFSVQQSTQQDTAEENSQRVREAAKAYGG